MADHEHTRKAFEDAVFNRRFRASIRRNPNPPKGFGGLDFISTDCPTQAELCKRGADGEYVDDTVSAMWWGWCAALTRGVALPVPTFEQVMEIAGKHDTEKNAGLMAFARELLSTYGVKEVPRG
jgi:hypothetical protein